MCVYTSSTPLENGGWPALGPKPSRKVFNVRDGGADRNEANRLALRALAALDCL
jgi:hypothetical protein